MEASGAQWAKRFPGSNKLEDLEPVFQPKAAAFIEALKDAGASVSIAATLRPKQRAYLMHWCCKVAGYKDKGGNFIQVQPSLVPAMPGVDIDWTHGGNVAAARAAAKAMVAAYKIAYPAALASRHTEGRAIDMTIMWKGEISVRTKGGVLKPCKKQEDLWPVGASYGVINLPSDPPHWSSDGR